ncbi:MAG TPA: glycosyltransferase family A protein [Verrucomicrobiae bacterium]|nr:glycosyltransferase family A protein [Verrucomicrobiae bacterium]
MTKPLVSVVVPTKNSSQTLAICLQSLAKQSYQPIEIIVVDNYSEDDTIEIAERYATKVFVRGPERCAQRNYGASKAAGEYVVMIDSDMKLESDVIAACVKQAEDDPDTAGIVIPEESYGIGFWAKCKQLERSFYQGVPWMEAARFFSREAFEKVSGYDENLLSGEDWDLSQRVAEIGTIGRVTQLIHHNEGHLRLGRTLSKKVYYARQFKKYMSTSTSHNTKSQTGIIKRYALFFRHPVKLFTHPLLGLGMLTMKTLEFAIGGFAFLTTSKEN